MSEANQTVDQITQMRETLAAAITRMAREEAAHTAAMREMLVTAIGRARREEIVQVTEMQRMLGVAIIDVINSPAWRAMVEELVALLTVPPSGLLAEAIRDALRGPDVEFEQMDDPRYVM